ncbi:MULTISPECIES: TetR/AcrR family transcriptional regulator [Paenibacillus]|uniref:TetR/AcrR family transcriptional regulator n=1 Tax=Paenibacillus agri TaxID=2744309 RepID=A0A850ERI7_9BACL|nr:TetR/AcrR family transcriptional regulator [Paenibacillus agri]NUU61824.1 TetR/AcrR family transcriptional regulator [Paenibacillus agri]
MKNSERIIVSRRDRPAKEPLSRELIVKTAYELLKEQGMAGMSMRKVAKALDTGPSSLYVYVNNLEDLSSYVLDYGLGELVLPDSGKGPWKERLFGALTAYFLLLIEQPGLSEISLSTMPRGDKYLELIEYLLTALHEGGAKSTAAAWGVDLLLLYVTSTAFEKHSWRKHGTVEMPAIKESFKKADPVRFPFIHSLTEELFSGGEVVMDRFQWGLEVMLQGIKLDKN